jgi:hypothetical protein
MHPKLHILALLTGGLMLLSGSAAEPLGTSRSGGEAGAKHPPTKQPLVIACFVPADRAPIPGYQERLDRVMTEVQQFYRKGMEAAGYGPMTFDLARDAQGKLEVHLVEGREPMRAYGRNDSDKVRNELAAALRARGLEVDGRTAVIFQVLLDWKNGSAIEVGPYVGGGDHLSGTAWVYDDGLLDPRQLSSKEPGGFYHLPCSIGKFNSHYIGGVAHELGHALGLPHVAGAAGRSGHSLMGDGNHTYGEDLRGEGPGTYLHPASAMLLAKCRPFAGRIDGAELPPECQLSALQASLAGSQILLTGRIETHLPAFGLVAYNDASAIPADYDAIGWATPVDSAGKFRLAIDAGPPGSYELRLQACHTNGATSRFAIRYDVDASGTPDLAPFAPAWLSLSKAFRAYGAGAVQAAEAALTDMEKQSACPAEALRQAGLLRSLMRPTPPQALTQVPPDQSKVSVSRLRFTEHSVGWGQPLVNQVLAEGDSSCLLQVAGKVHSDGLYAHAPARHVLNLQGKWKRFISSYGLQDGHDGSVVFVVRADAREVFRSKRISDHQLRSLEVPLEGADQLELLVENAGDGASNDWGVWISPALTR